MYKNGKSESRYWLSDTLDEAKAPGIIAWKLARSIIEHENILVHHRMVWFLMSQAFFLAVYFFLTFHLAADTSLFYRFLPTLVSLFAIYICIVIQNGMNRAWDVTDKVTQEYHALQEQHGGRDPLVPILHNWNKKLRFFNQGFLPSGTAIFWLILSIPGIADASGDFILLLKPLLEFLLRNPLLYLSLSAVILAVALNYVGRKRE